VDKIHRPAGVRLDLNQDRRPGSHRTAPCAPLAYGEAFLPIEPVDAVDPGRFTLLAQQDEQPAITEALARVGEITQPQSQLGVRRPA
jgi:hypothetical protein